MARRSDPERLYDAHRACHLSRLVSPAKMSPDTAERWISAWEAEAAFGGLDRRTGDWWASAWDWIAEQRSGCAAARVKSRIPIVQSTDR